MESRHLGADTGFTRTPAILGGTKDSTRPVG